MSCQGEGWQPYQTNERTVFAILARPHLGGATDRLARFFGGAGVRLLGVRVVALLAVLAVAAQGRLLVCVHHRRFGVGHVVRPSGVFIVSYLLRGIGV